jgi:hypothetical protein
MVHRRQVDRVEEPTQIAATNTIGIVLVSRPIGAIKTALRFAITSHERLIAKKGNGGMESQGRLN